MHNERPGFETVGIDSGRGAAQTNRVSNAWHMLDSVQAQIRAADEKIRVLFSGTALLAAAVAIDVRGLSGGATTAAAPPDLVAIGLRVLLLVCVVFAVVAAIIALLPRVRQGKVERSLFFFGHIAATPHDAFIDELAAMPEELMVRQILSQVHVNAQIVSVKHLWTRRAALGFAAAVLMLLVTQTFLLFF